MYLSYIVDFDMSFFSYFILRAFDSEDSYPDIRYYKGNVSILLRSSVSVEEI